MHLYRSPAYSRKNLYRSNALYRQYTFYSNCVRLRHNKRVAAEQVFQKKKNGFNTTNLSPVNKMEIQNVVIFLHKIC